MSPPMRVLPCACVGYVARTSVISSPEYTRIWVGQSERYVGGWLPSRLVRARSIAHRSAVSHLDLNDLRSGRVKGGDPVDNAKKDHQVRRIAW